MVEISPHPPDIIFLTNGGRGAPPHPPLILRLERLDKHFFDKQRLECLECLECLERLERLVFIFIYILFKYK